MFLLCCFLSSVGWFLFIFIFVSFSFQFLWMQCLVLISGCPVFKYVNPFSYLLTLAWWSDRLKHNLKKKKKKKKGLDFLTFLPHIPTFYDFEVFFFSFGLFKATPMAYGDSQARGQIRAVVAGLHHSHSNSGSKPHLWLTPLITAMLDP